MNRNEIAAQINAYETTINHLQAEIAKLQAELDQPEPIIIREVQPEEKKAEAQPEQAAEVSDKLINDLNEILGTEVHVLMGVGRTRNGHGGAKAAQTRRINRVMKNFTTEQIQAGMDAAKVNNVNSMFHYANDDRGHAPTAEKNIAYRFGL